MGVWMDAAIMGKGMWERSVGWEKALGLIKKGA